MPKIFELEPGTRFRYPELGKTAVLLSLGSSGARVKFEGTDRVVTIEPNPEVGREGAEFIAPGRAVLVSDYSDVEVL